MPNYLFYILLIVTTLSCQKVDKKHIPDKLLTEDELALILIDVAQIKAIKTNYLKEFKDTGINANQYLCYKYDVDSITLENNLKYYSYEPNELKKIYEKVYDSLEKSKTEITNFIKLSKKDNSKNNTTKEEEVDSLAINISRKRLPSSPTNLKNKTRN